MIDDEMVEDESLLRKKYAVMRVIDDAFHDIPYPGDDKVLGTGDFDELKLFCKSDWHDVDSDTLDRHWDMFYFFTGGVFQFLLPAFMINALDGRTTEFIISTFIPPPFGSRSEVELAERFRGLSDEQFKAIRVFLTWIEEEWDFFDDLPSGTVQNFWDDPKF